MEKIKISKSLMKKVFADGKNLHEGDEFVYNHDFENAGEFEIVGEQNGKKAPEPEPDKKPEGSEGDAPVDTLTVEEMKAIRLKAKDLKIANWHTKGVARLLAEIAEAEGKGEQNEPEPEVINGDEVTPIENSGDKVVVSELETVDETVNEGNANA